MNLAASFPDSGYRAEAVYDPGSGKIFVLGGRKLSGIYRQTWEYDPAANTWNADRADAPDALYLEGASVLDGMIYLAVDIFDRFYRYDIAANVWARMAPIPGGFDRGPVSVAFNDRIYLISGAKNNHSTDSKQMVPGAARKILITWQRL